MQVSLYFLAGRMRYSFFLVSSNSVLITTVLPLAIFLQKQQR
jgi:hypothetical protein